MSNDRDERNPDQQPENDGSAHENQDAPDQRSTRRGFVRHGLTKAAYLAPIVATLAAPTSVFAASGGGPSCGSVDAPCVDVSDCCADMDCNMSKCCGEVGFACTVDGDCCGTSNCTGGFCD